jgi:hypothetical protein
MGSADIDVSMSIDGFVAGPHDSKDAPLGENGERLHEWMFHQGRQHTGDAQVVQELMSCFGAVLMGRRTFDLGAAELGRCPVPGALFSC